ncbi:Sugar ABC transporter substrate-binding protein OS=Streptomyces fumanus OX=67302 GN=GCM10018772_08230 PE=4 SV=1 [Streptomyces fumanus]
MGKVGGKQYGVYYKAEQVADLVQHPGLRERGGRSEPKTWDELLTAAQTVYASGGRRSRWAAPTAGP